MVNPSWGDEHPNGAPPLWWNNFGVKDVPVEAHHGGGPILGSRTSQWRPTMVVDQFWGAEHPNEGPPWW